MSPAEILHRLVAHMTRARERSAGRYDYRREFNAIDPALLELIREVKGLFAI